MSRESSPYKDISILQCSLNDERVTNFRLQIIDDIGDKQNESYMVKWFTEPKWTKNNFELINLVLVEDKIIAISCNKVQPDNTVKVLCHYYVLRDYRSKYRSLQHTDIIPSDVEYAKSLNLSGIWYSIHAFDQRHKRYAESNIRMLNGGKVGYESQPYWPLFKYEGEVSYNNVMQHKFYFDLNRV